ncbi:hypothetical protein Hanom_Chr17g01548531 [Helianthus anomalus]
MRREFLWGMETGHQKVSWVSLDIVSEPKDLGGIRIGSLKKANIAMLAKWWWRFKIEKDNTWRKVI